MENRYAIRQVNLYGEKLSADQDAVNIFKTEMDGLLTNYTKDQIYNADETGLNFKMLSKKSQRITILFCSNAAGTHRLRPMCVGKSKKPRALKYVSEKALPVFYRCQKSSWMSTTLFSEWFKNGFVPNVKSLLLKSKNLPIKALLLVDNAPTHPQNLQNGDIIVRFVPPNVTSLIQPLEQGVIKTFKRHYREAFLRHLLSQETNKSKSIPEIL